MKYTMRSIALAVLAAFALSGCATGYDKYLAQVGELNKAQKDSADLQLAALRSDKEAIAKLAEGGSDVVKVAAANAIAMQNIVAVLVGNNSKASLVVPQAPKDPMESFTQMLGMVIPSAVQVYGITKNAAVAIRQSDNSTAIAVSTNQAFEHIATGGFSALASVNPQPNITTTNTLNAGGDAINGNNNSTSRKDCNGGNATSSGNGGNAAAGGNGGNAAGTTSAQPGGAGAPSGAAGNGTPTGTAGSASC